MTRIQNAWDRMEDPQYIHSRNVACSRKLLDILISVHGTEDDLEIVKKPEKKPAKPHRNLEPKWWHTMWFGNLVDLDMQFPGDPLTVSRIQSVVAKEYGLTRDDILSAKRTHKYIMPRHIAMYLAKEMTGKSTPEIGRRFGNRDHTSAMYAIQKISARCVSDQEFAIKISALKAEIMA